MRTNARAELKLKLFWGGRARRRAILPRIGKVTDEETEGEVGDACLVCVHDEDAQDEDDAVGDAKAEEEEEEGDEDKEDEDDDEEDADDAEDEDSVEADDDEEDDEEETPPLR
jgi:hypothetical protein